MNDEINLMQISDELIAKANAVQEYNHKGAVTVDYIGSDVYLCGHKFPAGQLACDVLNIPEDIINELLLLSTASVPLAKALYYTDSECEIPGDIIEKARSAALKAVEIYKSVRPFSYFKSDEYIKDFTLLSRPIGPADNTLPAVLGEPSFIITTILNTLEIGGSLAELSKMIIPLIEEADSDNSERSACGYARLFEKHFADASFSVGRWVPFSTVIQKHIAVDGVFGKRLEYMYFTEMLASDFIEGLKAGHAPKKCRMCGRYFLTTDAHHPHYCNDANPDDPRGRTCRKLAKQKNSSERAKDNPRIVIKNKALANLRQSKSRGKITEIEYRKLRELIINKSEKAAEKTDYCNGPYISEMRMESLRNEAGIT